MDSDDKIYAKVEKTGVDVFDINKNATVADKDVEPKQRRRQSPQNDRLWTRSDTEVFPTNSTPYRTEGGLDVTLTRPPENNHEIYREELWHGGVENTPWQLQFEEDLDTIDAHTIIREIEEQSESNDESDEEESDDEDDEQTVFSVGLTEQVANRIRELRETHVSYWR